MKIRCLIFALCFLAYPSVLFAESDMTITPNPKFPAPYQETTLTVVSYSFDVNTATITWSIGGKVFQSGIGLKQITLQTGAVGETLQVTVEASVEGGGRVQTGISLTPQSVDILWETPESYTPPFYEGKSLPGNGASVRVTALPNMSAKGLRVPAQNLSYSWYVNDDFLDSFSGYGKQSATIPLDYLSTKTDIKVLVRSTTGNSAQKTISIYPHDVMPLMYVYDDILGTKMETLLPRRFEAVQDFTLSLVPMYFSVKNNFSSSGTYTWLLNNLPVTPQEKTFMAFRPQENSRGIKQLSIILENTRRTLQDAQTDLEILFDTRR